MAKKNFDYSVGCITVGLEASGIMSNKNLMQTASETASREQDGIKAVRKDGFKEI